MYVRGLEHAADVKVSHMREHIISDHGELLPRLMEAPHTLFSMQIIHTARSALSRQIREAVEIGSNTTGGTILNSKEELSRCLIPVIHVEGPKNIQKYPKTQLSESKEQNEDLRALTRTKKRSGGFNT